MSALKTYLEEKKRAVEQALDLHLPPEDTRPEVLHKAMRYCAFSGGKRIRPIICLAAAEAAGGREKEAMLPAIAIEILHTYTLVHDDLPAMDDDDLRRGKPTAHMVYGEANAILTGDALLTLAFEWLAECRAPDPYLPNQFSLELAEAAGSRGVIAGQVEDILAEGREPDPELVDYIHLHKTAALFRAATRMGGIAAAATTEEMDALSLYGCNIGLAFQIVDDLLNETSSAEELGKPVGSDRERSKVTYVAVYGVKAARERARKLVEDAISALAVMRGSIDRLTELANTVIDRTH